jgi:hypothetical protein
MEKPVNLPPALPSDEDDNAAASEESIASMGDTHAADIVGPTGEEMPTQTHAEVHGGPVPPPERPPASPR